MWPNPQFPADLVTFTEEILNGKLHFLCSGGKSKVFSISTSSIDFRISNLDMKTLKTSACLLYDPTGFHKKVF